MENQCRGGKIHKNLPYRGRIALCFLVTKNIINYGIWKKWWKGYEKYLSIYVHISGKNFYKHNPKSNYKFNKIVWQNRIKNPRRTKWGDVSLVMAEGLLYDQALQQYENKYFCVVSESGIPVRSFTDFYKTIFRSKKSRMNIGSMRGVALYNGGVYKDCFPRKFIPISNNCTTPNDDRCLLLKNSHQWKILNRRDAKAFVDMTNNTNYILAYTNCFVFDPHQLAPDELAFVNWIIIKYGNKELKKRFINTETTFADFDPRGEHALTYNYINPGVFESLCNDTNIVFARKFKGNKKLIKQLPIQC